MIYNGTNAIIYFLEKKNTPVSFKELIEITGETMLKYLLRIAYPTVTRRTMWIAELSLS